MIDFPCSECGATLSVKSKYAGRSRECPECKSPVRVPEEVPVFVSAKKRRERQSRQKEDNAFAAWLGLASILFIVAVVVGTMYYTYAAFEAHRRMEMDQRNLQKLIDEAPFQGNRRR